MSYSETLKAVNDFTYFVPPPTTGPEFYPKKHPYSTYGAQQRAAKKRRKSKTI